MHVKRQILHLVRAALLAALPGVEVHLDRLDPIPARRCPAALVREADAGESIAPLLLDGTQQRALLVTISLCVTATDDHGDAVDALGLLVEKLFGAEHDNAEPLVQQLITLCRLGIELRGSRPFQSGEGETAIAVLQHTWQFSYQVHQAAPDVAITT